MGRVTLGAAALIVLGAGLASPWPQEYRAALLGGAAVILLWLAQDTKNGPRDGGR